MTESQDHLVSSVAPSYDRMIVQQYDEISIKHTYNSSNILITLLLLLSLIEIESVFHRIVV
jgi:hypothetical protein